MTELLGLSGSLRKASSATALLEALGARMPQQARMTRADIGVLPHYNADLQPEASVRDFIAQIERAAGVILVTPEYNYSVPGVLKNAIDWASRPAYNSVFKGKPCLVMTVSGGLLGGARAQAHLKYILNGMLAEVFPCQEIVVPHAPKRMHDGVFADTEILDFALKAVDDFVTHIKAR